MSMSTNVNLARRRPPNNMDTHTRTKLTYKSVFSVSILPKDTPNTPVENL
jgi:hypothetical protein